MKIKIQQDGPMEGWSEPGTPKGGAGLCGEV